MFTLTQILIPVALLASAVWGLPLTQESVVDGLSLDLPVRFGFPLNDDDRIFGGEEASVGQFPHQASLRLLGLHICGGSIISDRFVLTAGHCYLKEIPFLFLYGVVVGGHRGNGSDGAAHGVQRFIVHEHFNVTFTNQSATVRNDIALIETTKPIAFSKLVAPITLERTFYDGQVQAVTSGWGKTNDQVTNLKFVNVHTLTNEACRQLIGGASDQSPPVHDWDTICATTAKVGHGVCSGDSGGPLVSNNTLIGITSWGDSKCASGLPDGYTRVSTYVDWISEKTKLPF